MRDDGFRFGEPTKEVLSEEFWRVTREFHKEIAEIFDEYDDRFRNDGLSREQFINATTGVIAAVMRGFPQSYHDPMFTHLYALVMKLKPEDMK